MVEAARSFLILRIGCLIFAAAFTLAQNAYETSRTLWYEVMNREQATLNLNIYQTKYDRTHDITRYFDTENFGPLFVSCYMTDLSGKFQNNCTFFGTQPNSTGSLMRGTFKQLEYGPSAVKMVLVHQNNFYLSGLSNSNNDESLRKFTITKDGSTGFLMVDQMQNLTMNNVTVFLTKPGSSTMFFIDRTSRQLKSFDASLGTAAPVGGGLLMHTLDCETPVLYRSQYFFVWGGVNQSNYEVVETTTGVVTANQTTGKNSIATFAFSAYNDSKIYSIEDNRDTNSLQLYLRSFGLTSTMTELARVDDALGRQQIVTFKNWLYIAVVVEESTNARIKLFGSEFLQSLDQYFPSMGISFIYDNSFIAGPQGRYDALMGFTEEMTVGTTEASRFWLLRIHFDSCIDRDNSTMICTRCPAGYYLNGTYTEQNMCIEDTKGSYIYSMKASDGGQSNYNVEEYRTCAIAGCQRCAADYTKCDHCLSNQLQYYFMNETTTSTTCLIIKASEGFNVSNSNFVGCRDPNCEDCRENYRMCTKCKQPPGNPMELIAGRCSPILEAPFIVSNTTDVFNHKLTIQFSGSLSLEYVHTCSEYPDRDVNDFNLDRSLTPNISCCSGEEVYSVDTALTDRNLNANYSCKIYKCSINRDSLEVVFNESFETFNSVFNLSLPKCTVLRVGNSTWANFSYSCSVQFYKQWAGVSESTRSTVKNLVRNKWIPFVLLVSFAPHVASKVFKVYSHIKLMSLLGLSQLIYSSLVFREINTASSYELDWRKQSKITRRLSESPTSQQPSLISDPEYLECGFPQLPFTNFVGCGPFEILHPDIDFVVLAAVVSFGAELGCFLLALLNSIYALRYLKKIQEMRCLNSDQTERQLLKSPESCKERMLIFINYLRSLFGLNMLMTVLDGLSPLLVYASLSALFSRIVTLETKTSNSSIAVSYVLLGYYFILPWILSVYREYTHRGKLDEDLTRFISNLAKKEGAGGPKPPQPQVQEAAETLAKSTCTDKCLELLQVNSQYSIRYLRKLSEFEWSGFFKTLQMARDLAFPLLLYFEADPVYLVWMQSIYLGLVCIMLWFARQLDYATEGLLAISVLVSFTINFQGSDPRIDEQTKELSWAPQFVATISLMVWFLIPILFVGFLTCIALFKNTDFYISFLKASVDRYLKIIGEISSAWSAAIWTNLEFCLKLTMRKACCCNRCTVDCCMKFKADVDGSAGRPAPIRLPNTQDGDTPSGQQSGGSELGPLMSAESTHRLNPAPTR